MITIDLSILNQKGTPMFYSDIFAARPPFGIAGRIFISTDTKEFYRDTGTSWELLAGPGGGTITGSGTTGTLPIFTGSSTIGDSSLLEGASKFTTTKDFQADAIYLNSMTGGSGALYYSGNRLTLANYNAGGDVMIEANSGASAQFISGTNLSTTFYGNIIRNGGLSTQFLKADGSLDSTAYQPLITNPVTGTGAATQVAFWSSGTALSGNNNLWWDNVNSRLGIGNNNPASNLDIHGNNATIQIDGRSTSSAFVQFVTQGVSKWRIGNLSPSNYFQIYDNANSLERIKLENTGLLTLTGNMTNVLTQTATGGSGWYGIFSNENITIPASTTFSGGNSFSSVNGKNGMTFAGSATFGLDNVPSGILSTNILSFSSAGSTITINQAGGVRAMSAITAFNQINSTNNGTISHIAGLQVIAPYSGAGTLTATNYYGLLLNASNERTAFTITNSWGIYQEGSSDKNYLNGTTLIGTNVDTLSGAKLQVNGAATFSSSVTANGNTTNSAVIFNNAIGSSGTAQYYADFTAGATVLGRISRGNGASGLEANGLNIDNFAGFKVRLNQLGGSGGSFTIDGGNLGLGVTPSAWGSPFTAIQGGSFGQHIGFQSNAADMIIGVNNYYNGTNYIYATSNGAAHLSIRGNSGFVWNIAPSGTAGNAITFTQAMTLNASGNLQIGNTTGGDFRLFAYQNASTGSSSAMVIRQDGSDDIVRFNSLGSNVVTFKSSGRVLIGTTTDNTIDLLQVAGSGYFNGKLTIQTPTSDTTVGFNLRAYTTGADGDRTVISRYTSSNDNNWANSVYRAWAHIWETNGTERMRINAAGGIEMKDSLKLTNFTTSGTAGSIVNYVQITVGTTNYLLPLYNLP